MDGEDKLGSSASFSVPVFRSFKSSPGYSKLTLVDFFDKVAFIEFLHFLADVNMVQSTSS